MLKICLTHTLALVWIVLTSTICGCNNMDEVFVSKTLKPEIGSFDRIQSRQNHLILCSAVSSRYSDSHTLQQRAYVHWLQASHIMPCWFPFTGFSHIVHGYCTGPGLDSMSPEASSRVMITAAGRWTLYSLLGWICLAWACLTFFIDYNYPI